MKPVSLAVLSLLGLAAAAGPARADDLSLDIGFEVRGARVRDGYVGGGADRPIDARPLPGAPAPVARRAGPTFVPDPAHWMHRGGFDDRDRHGVYVPAHFERRTETVCDPAVYDDRVVPVFERRAVPVFDEVEVPVYREVTVPVFEERLVPRFDIVLDRRTGRPHRVQVGVRAEQVRVGERTQRVQSGTRHERVRVGERHEQVQVGTRIERVLVRAERCRVVERREWVPGRYLAYAPSEHDRRHDDRRGDDDRHSNDDRRGDRR